MKPAKGVQKFRPISVIRSILKTRCEAPMQGSEGAPHVWLEVKPFATQALDGPRVGDDIIVVTWLHQARRDVLKVYPGSDRRRPSPIHAGFIAFKKQKHGITIECFPSWAERRQGNPWWLYRAFHSGWPWLVPTSSMKLGHYRIHVDPK